jgi:hypothetical protein
MTFQFFLKRAIRLKAEKQAEQNLHCFSDSKKIVILTSENLEKVQINMKWLAQTFPHFETIQLFNLSKDKTAISQNFQNVCMREVNLRNFTLFGGIKEELELELKKMEFDLLINADISSNLFLHLIASTIKAKLKTGIYDDVCIKLYKLKLYAGEEIELKDYIEQTYSYLEALCGKIKK